MRLFAMKTRAETGWSEEDYRKARKSYFSLKYRLLLPHFLIGFAGAAVLCLLMIPAVGLVKGWDVVWSGFPWGRWFALVCVMGVLAGLALALGNFFFAIPFPPDRKGERDVRE